MVIQVSPALSIFLEYLHYAFPFRACQGGARSRQAYESRSTTMAGGEADAESQMSLSRLLGRERGSRSGAGAVRVLSAVQMSALLQQMMMDAARRKQTCGRMRRQR